MYRIEYKGKTYEGRTEKEFYLDLRKRGRLTHEQIAILTNKSKQWVAQVLGPTGKLEFPELSNPETFRESDEAIAFSLSLPVSRISAARRKLGLKSKSKVSVNQRRKRLCLYLFGHEPGLNFPPFLREHIKKLSPGKAKVMEDFYLDGLSQSLSDDVNSDSDRVYRHLARKELKEIVGSFNIKWLKEKDIINGNRTQ